MPLQADPPDSPDTLRKITAARTVRGRPYSDRMVAAPSFARLFRQQVDTRGDDTYLIWRDGPERKVFTYRQFFGRASGVARFMRDRLGIRPGDRISTVAYNHPDTVTIYYAAWLVGAVAVPCNVGDTDEQLLFVQQNAQCRAVFVMPDLVQRYNAIRPRLTCCEHFIQIGGATTPGYADLSAALNDTETPFPQLDLANQDTEALIVYTSGTTGAPKGVVLQQYQLLVDAQSIAAWHRFTPADRAMIVLPIHHVNGLVVTLLTSLYIGGSAILNRKFSAGQYWDVAAQEQATWGSVVPTILAFLGEKAQDLSNHDLGRLRYLICGAGPLTVERIVRFEAQFHIPIIHGYGLSETTAYNCFLPIDLPDAQRKRWLSEFGYPSIGVPIDCNEMAIHDDHGQEVPEGVKGEIVIRGHDVMKGYFNRPEANAHTFEFNWFRSGDEGFYRLDERGQKFFFISGRIKELIIRGGVNYSPLEIDEVLNRIPGVRAGMAVAFENDFYGEEVGAFVVLQEGATLSEQDVLRACTAHLPFSQRPKVVVIGDSFPVTATGKYQRTKLKPLFAGFRAIQFREDKSQPRA